MSSGELRVVAPAGTPEVRPGDDLAELLLGLVELQDGDVVVVTSKVVSKSEGRLRAGSREESLADETVRVVARRGPTTIVRTRHGLTMAAAGIDASNVAVGTIVLLPLDPDDSARRLRAALRERTGRTVAVVVTDTAGRAWREGQTDIAVGAAGLRVLESFEGRTDAHGNPLAVTAPAVADEIASMAELAQGKLGGRPFAVVRGRADLVLAPDDDGTGARALVRAEGADLFGYGAREAVVRALAGHAADRAPFGAPVDAEELVALLTGPLAGLVHEVADEDGEVVVRPIAGAEQSVRALAFAHGWQEADPGTVADSSACLRLVPATP
ncbi:coenzyme F420-0:L-glutamate ligase [Nocardioides sp.]|uniref:coenzyme F420-0:L-glutamate ligase n=1 Tax=Nocardioides sp. TaxID=35761 RepID=UPI003563E2DE